MADDVLVEKLFNFICGSGGFVELSVLLRRSSPLGSRKTETEARNWLNNQTEFLLVKDVDDKVTGVRINLKKKVCSQYVSKGSCRKKKGICNHWHICKTFIEGKCNGSCGLSHDFHNEANGEMARELGLEKYSSGALKNIVAWSLPLVCESYLKNECKSEKCPYIHVCSKAVRGSLCGCALSHNLTDSHNMRILKRYDLVPQSRAVNVDFVRCSILVLCEVESVVSQNGFNAGANGVAIETETATVVTSATLIGNDASGKPTAENALTSKTTTTATVSSNSHSVNTITDQTATANALTRGTAAANVVISQTRTANAVTSKSATGNAVNGKIENATTVASKSEGTAVTSNSKIAATSADSSKTTKATAATSDAGIPAKSRFNICGSASVFFDRLCKEFNCSAPLADLKKRQVVLSNELKDFLTILEENKDKFLVVRNGGGIIQEITAFCSKLRLCLNFVSLNRCRKATCPDFHLCRKFITGTCKHGEHCSRSHSFRNKRDNKTLLQLKLDGLTNEELRQLMLSSSPQVCIDYNKGKCTLGSSCSRVHICKNYVTNACTNERCCPLDHKPALTNQHTNSLLDKYMFDLDSRANVLKAILVCEEQEESCSPATKLTQKEDEGVKSKSADAVTGRASGESSGKIQTVPTTASATTRAVSIKLPAVNAAADKATSTPTLTFAAKELASNAAQTTVASKTGAVNAVTRKAGASNSVSQSSVSGSCSSGTTPDKFAPSKSTIFECICKEYNGSVSFAQISKRQDLLPSNSHNIGAWFREHKESFLLGEDTDGNILHVSAFCPNARLCFDYLYSQSCSREDCQYFHVCREYVAGCCRFGSRCKWYHSFRFDEERKFTRILGLDGLTHEELRKVLQLSMPQVCLDYNEGYCAKGSSCSQIHICKNFVKKRCDDEDDCGLQHEHALLTSHSTSVLENYNLRCIDGNFKFVLKELLVCDDSSRRLSKERRSKSISQLNTVSKMKRGTSIDYSSSQHQVLSVPRRRSLPLVNESEVRGETFSSIKSSETTWTPCFPSERQVFESLCTEYDCSASFAAIARRTDLFPHGVDSAESWFRRTKGSFLITESDKEIGTISRVEAFSKEARLCLGYITDKTCQKVTCQCLHVCKNHITNCCSSGTVCPMNHVFHNKRDKAFLSRTKLDLLTEEQLRKLVLLSTPQICVEYNNGICPNGDSCRRIHICCSYLKKSCDEEYYCGLDHEKALSTGHTQSVLQRLQFSTVSKPDALKIILDDKRILSTEEKKKNCHIHQDKPDAYICSHFLVGLCRKGLRCADHHCSLPYHWQYQVPNVDVWKSFGAKDNLALEKLYCDVNVESRVKFTPTEALDFSLQESETLSDEYGIIIDLDNMLMFLRPKSASGPFISQLRRLSTIPSETCPCAYVSTFWKWYWKENGNVWRTFDEDRWGRNLENMIERAYLDKLEQGKPREKFKFITPQHEYKLFFYSTGMYQENLKTGTRRPVRRRPGEFVCSEDVEDLKWKFGDPTDKEQVSKVSVESKYTPTYWSPMPPHAPYLRAWLTQSSNEFKVVERLFRRTMNDYVNIIQIDRIQNPFMMEKYYRKKENMASAAKRTQDTVDERQLFHGTSPDAVEAICKQNFDWRLHGKNATVYGQGSYFAKKASYSHAYAKRDPHGFQYIFLAKVLVGAYTTGHSSYRRPPPKRPSDPASDLYDSCVDKQSSPTIFVVFDTDQFYPEYLIKYTTATQTTSSTGHHALPQPAAAVSARTKTKTSSQAASGKQRQLASSMYPVSKSSYPDESDAFSELTGYSPPVYRRPKAQSPNTNTPVVSATYLRGILRNGNSSTLSASQLRRPLGTSLNLPGSATGSVSSSIAASWSHPLKSSNHPASTTSSSGSVSQSRRTPMVTSTIASRKSTPSVTASSQSAAAAKSDSDHANGFDLSYVVLPSTRPNAPRPNTNIPVVSATYLRGILRNGNSSTLSASQLRRPLGTSLNLPGSATGSVSSSIAASWSHPLKSSNHPASTTSSSGSVSQSRHTPMVTSTIASRKSTPSVIASSQSAAAVESDFDCVNGFDSSYVVLPSTSQTAVQNTSQPSSLNPPYASSMGSTRTADTSIVSSTSSRGSFTDTNENTFPQKKKKEKFLKCPIS